jgi:hypothetical protein
MSRRSGQSATMPTDRDQPGSRLSPLVPVAVAAVAAAATMGAGATALVYQLQRPGDNGWSLLGGSSGRGYLGAVLWGSLPLLIPAGLMLIGVARLLRAQHADGRSQRAALRLTGYILVFSFFSLVVGLGAGVLGMGFLDAHQGLAGVSELVAGFSALVAAVGDLTLVIVVSGLESKLARALGLR